MYFTRILSFVFLVSFLFACKKEKPEIDQVSYDTAISHVLKDISYGKHSRNVMDVYLPANRSEQTKIFVMIHGGGWNAGDKNDFADSYNWLKQVFPTHAIININYRLGTLQQPGYDMQINDIQSAIDEISKAKYGLGSDLFMVGASAGAHLSMMYAYRHDTAERVKGVCNIVGPADFTDPSYTNNPSMLYGLSYLIGPFTYQSYPNKWKAVSPVEYVKSSTPPTISFYGDQDHLIPSTQVHLLDSALLRHNITHESTLYPGEGHSGWNAAHTADFVGKAYQFILTHF